MFKRILTSAALVLGLAIPAGAGVALIAPGIAHATGYQCGTASSFNNEDAGYNLYSNGRSSPNNDVFPSDSYNGEYPVLVGATPSGSWASFALWDICWTTSGSNLEGYYGTAAFQNHGSGLSWGASSEWTNTQSGDAQYYWSFQCLPGGGFNLSNQAWPREPNTGYWSTFGTFSNIEAISAGAGPNDTFTEIGTAPRFC